MQMKNKDDSVYEGFNQNIHVFFLLIIKSIT